MSEQPSDPLFPEYVYNEYPSLLAGSNWKKEHDLSLLTAFTKYVMLHFFSSVILNSGLVFVSDATICNDYYRHGYARYVPIVEDRENGIAERVSKELNLTIPSVNGSFSANGAQSGDGASSSNVSANIF
jgi:hypothetical protein